MEINETWWKEAVIYQIYPRSFCDSNADGFGDLPGITRKLDYLANLGVDAVWLSPIYPSPDADFGYDVSDYRAVDPRYGTLEDFDTLVQEAHRRDIRIILDMVMNHTSDQHPWFQQARSGRNNPYRDWYIWRDAAPNGGLPNNWASQFGGSAWQWDPQTAQYYLHLFARQQPDLNWRNPAVKEEIFNIYRFWCDRGVDGFRLDVFNALFKDARFTGNPPRLGIRRFDRQKHLHDINRPEMVPFLKDLRALLDTCPGRYMVGEAFLETRGVVGQYVGDSTLHAAFDFELLLAAWNPGRIKQAVLDWEAELGPEKWPTQVLNNHDNPRSASRYRAPQNDRQLKQAAALLLTLRGTPFLYYGEEIGMRDIKLKRGEILDPAGRYYWPFYPGRDGCRSPMQWDSSPQAGFSSAKPWLPLNTDYTQRNAAVQSNKPGSLLAFYQAIIRLRRQHPALRTGTMRFLDTAQDPCLMYVRENEHETILIAINFSAKPVRFEPDGDQKESLADTGWELLLSSARQPGEWQPASSIHILPEEAIILRKNQIIPAPRKAELT